MSDTQQIPARAGTTATPVAFRAGGFELKSNRFISLAALVTILAIWEGAGRLGMIRPIFLPWPSLIWASFVDLINNGVLWGHIKASLGRVASGWFLGTLAGIVVGTLVGISMIGRSVVVPIVSALFPIPKIALLPLFILWLGIGEESKIATIGLGVFFPTVISAYSGVDAVPRSLVRMAQSFNLPLRVIVWRVILPGALPGMISGARISSSIALLLVVSAEMIGAQQGIGAFVLNAGNLMQTDQLLIGVFVLSALGLLFASLLGWLEGWLLRWR